MFGEKKRVQLVDDVLDLPLRWWLVEKKNQKTRDRWDVVVVVVVVVVRGRVGGGEEREGRRERESGTQRKGGRNIREEI